LAVSGTPPREQRLVLLGNLPVVASTIRIIFREELPRRGII
jgi:hypothetical protein